MALSYARECVPSSQEEADRDGDGINNEHEALASTHDPESTKGPCDPKDPDDLRWMRI